MHAESLQLSFHRPRRLGVVRFLEVLAHRLRLPSIERLAQVDAVGGDDLVQAAQLGHQFLGAGWPHRVDVQLRDHPGQRGTGGVLGVHLALLLQLQAALEQLLDHAAVVRVFEKAVDFKGDFQADVGQVGQHLGQCFADALQRTQGARQHLGRLLTHIRDAQRIDEPRQGRPFAVFDGREQVVAGHLGKPFQLDHVVELQGVEVGWRVHQAFVDQLLDAFLTQPVDVHGAPRDEMDDRLLELRATGQPPDAAIDRAFADGLLALAALDQLGALDVGTAHRTGFRDVH